MPLEGDTVVHLLEDTPEEDCLTFAPTNPKNGDWFVFSYSGLHPACEKAWKKDSIRWRHNGTHKKIVNDRKLNIRYYKRIFPSYDCQFVRYTYEILDADGNNSLKRMLVHYLCYYEVCEPMASENSCSSAMKLKLGIGAPVLVKVGDLTEGQFYTVKCDHFLPDVEENHQSETNQIDKSVIINTVASILHEESQEATTPLRIKKSKPVTGIDSSNNFFYEEVVSTSEPNVVPRTVVEDPSTRYNNDETDTSVDSGLPYVYRIERNAMDCAHDFLHKIKDTHSIFYQIIPTTIVIMACKSGINEYKTITKTHSGKCVLFYDRVWQVGSLYVACLYTRHVLCEREGLFPLAFAVYELEDSRTHTVILENLLHHYKAFDSEDQVLLIDSSPSVLNACLEVLPQGIKLASSWTNIVEAVKLWFSKHDSLNQSWSSTVELIKKLLQSQTLEEYLAQYQIFSLDWCTEFKSFYNNFLSHVATNSTAEHLLAMDMYSKFGLSIPGHRIFLQQMESVFVDTDVATVDYLVHLGYYLLYYYHNEIEKGKIISIGTHFRRKRENLVLNTKKRCFFPSRCALSEDLTTAILHRMQVPQTIKDRKESPFIAEEIPTQENIQLCNIEIEIDADMNSVTNGYHEFSHGPLQEMTIGEQVINLDADNPLEFVNECNDKVSLQCQDKDNTSNNFEYINQNNDFASSEDEQSIMKFGISSKSGLIEEIIQQPSQNITTSNIKNNHILKTHPNKFSLKKSLTSNINSRSSHYMHRKKSVDVGHSLFNRGCVTYDASSNSYIVTHRNQTDRVKLTPRRMCSCSKKQDCPHIVAVMLEAFCRERPEDIPWTHFKGTSVNTEKYVDLNGEAPDVLVTDVIPGGLVLDEEIVDDEDGYDVVIGGE